MPNCAISGCSNTSAKGCAVIIHRFPSDLKLAAIWERRCNRNKKLNLKNSRICSVHFSFNSYKRDLKAELLGEVSRKRLKDEAVPTLKLPPDIDIADDLLEHGDNGVNTSNKSSAWNEYIIKVENNNEQLEPISYSELEKSYFNDSQKLQFNTISAERKEPGTESATEKPLLQSKRSLVGASDVNLEELKLDVKNQQDLIHRLKINEVLTSNSSSDVNLEELKLDVKNQQDLIHRLKINEVLTSNSSSDVNLEELKLDVKNQQDLIHRLKNNKKTHFIRNEVLTSNSANLIIKIASLKHKSRLQMAKFKKLKKELAEERRIKVKAKITIKSEIRKALGKTFTPRQINRLINAGKRNWKLEDIANAMALRALSPKMYLHLRKRIGIPLPSVSICKRWSKRIRCSPGLQNQVLKLMEARAKTMGEFELPCVVIFGHTLLESETSDGSTIKVLQAVLVRSLTSNWKQIVFYQFDDQFTVEILKNVIRKVEDSGFQVVGMVSVMDDSNINLWNELSICADKTSFPNPADESREIYVFADITHLLNMLRDSLLGTGLELNGQNFFLDIFEQIRASEDSATRIEKFTSFFPDSKALQAVTPEKISLDTASALDKTFPENEVNSGESQGVTPIEMIFSLDTVGAIKKTYPDRKVEYSFFKLISDFISVMKSGMASTHSDEFRTAFGVSLDSQLGILNDMLHTVQILRASGQASLCPFQIGIIITIKSLLSLYNCDFIVSKGIEYIFTNRLSLEPLRNIFSQLEGMKQFGNRNINEKLRLLLLGDQLQENKKGKYYLEGQMITTSLFNSLKIGPNSLVVGSKANNSSNK